MSGGKDKQAALLRRYGLEPLPDDASAAEREARLAQLTGLRRARQRRIALRSGLGLLLLVGLALGLLWWLVSTLAGRDMLLAQIKARLPANASLEWQSAEGPVRGPMVLHGVTFTWIACADDDFDVNTTAMSQCQDQRRTVFTASRLLLHPRLGALLGYRLQLDALEVEGAALDIAKSDAPFELPTWPEVLPRVEPPLPVDIARLTLHELAISSAGEPVITLHAVDGALLAEPGRLQVDALRVRSSRGSFTLDGEYAPGNDYATDLTATAVFPAPLGQRRARVGLVARGNLQDMRIGIGGSLPDALRAELRLHADSLRAANAGSTRWQLTARSEGLNPTLLLGERGGEAMQFHFNADGEGGRAKLHGEWSQGELRVVLKPSQLALVQQTLHAQPLVVEALGGELRLTGQGMFKDDAANFDFAAQARNLAWGDENGQPLLRGDGDFTLKGTAEAWQVKGNATLTRAKQTAEVTLDGQGDGNGLDLNSLRAVMPEGRLDARGRVDWAPRTRWKADATLAGFDPGYFLPKWRGAVRGKLASEGQLDAGNRLQADISLRELGGQLRGRSLAGHGELKIRGTQYSGDADLRLGSSHVRGQGHYGQTLDAHITLAPLQLADLLPDASGSLRGELHLGGAPSRPSLRGQLDGEGLHYAGYRAQRLRLDGALPWQGDGGQLTLSARGLEAGMAFHELEVSAQGAVENLRLEARAHTDAGRVQLAGSSLRRGQNLHGQLARLELTPTRGAPWRLQAPLDYAQNGNTWSLTRGCFTSGAGGSLCAEGQWPGRGIQVQGHALPLQLVSAYLPEREDKKAWLIDGGLDIDAHLAPQGDAWRAQAQLRSASGSLRLGNAKAEPLVQWQALKLDTTLTPQRIEARLDTGISGNGTLKASLATGWEDSAPLSGSLEMNMRELSMLEAFVPDLVDPTGTVAGQISLSGTRASPLLGGQARLDDFRAEVPAYGLVLDRGSFTLAAAPDGNARLNGTVRSGEGLLSVRGTLGWQNLEAPIVLDISGENVLLSDTRELRAVVNPDVQVRMQGDEPLTVSGRVTIPSARLDLERLDSGVSRSADVVVLDPANPERNRTSSLNLDLTLALGDDVSLHGFGLQGQLGGQMRVRAQPGREMRASGTLNVEGRYTAYGQKLLIDEGSINWSNDPVSNPSVNIRAKREIGDVTAGIHVTGRADAPQATVWANPAMDQSEALAYLALGRSLSTVSASEGKQINAASAALSAGGTFLASQLATRIGFDDAGMVQSNTLGGSVFGVGKYLSPRVYVSYGVSLLGTGQVLTLKYLLRRGFDITIESSTVENKASVNWRREK